MPHTTHYTRTQHHQYRFRTNTTATMRPQKEPGSWGEAIQQYHTERRGGITPPPLQPMNRCVACPSLSSNPVLRPIPTCCPSGEEAVRGRPHPDSSQTATPPDGASTDRD